jgi:hypothetical protein
MPAVISPAAPYDRNDPGDLFGDSSGTGPPGPEREKAPTANLGLAPTVPYLGNFPGVTCQPKNGNVRPTPLPLANRIHKGPEGCRGRDKWVLRQFTTTTVDRQALSTKPPQREGVFSPLFHFTTTTTTPYGRLLLPTQYIERSAYCRTALRFSPKTPGGFWTTLAIRGVK